MTARTPSLRPARVPLRADRWRDALLLGAPGVAVLGGGSAQWLDFRPLRIAILLVVGLSVFATAYALSGTRTGARPFLRTVLAGAATWAGVQCVYAVLHVAQGDAFDAARFGPQWSQAIALIVAHALFLGVPTGIVVALMLQARGLRAGFARGA